MISVSVIFTAPNSPGIKSKLICRFMGTPYSHIALVYKDCLYHAIGNGVTWDPGLTYLKDHTIVKSYNVELACSEDYFFGACAGERGKDYSQMQLILILLKMGWLNRLFYNRDEKMICSEFVAKFLRFSTIGSKLPKELDLITPKDLDLLLAER